MALSADQLTALAPLRLAHAPVAMAFLDVPPDGFDRIDKTHAAGCSYWKSASEGRAFYTTPEDHQSCPIGAYTHGVSQSDEQIKELHALLGTMVELKYLQANEISTIPHRTS